MKKRIQLDLNDLESTVKVTRALSSPARVEILRILIKKSCNVTELSDQLGLAISTIANHIRELEEAGLISTTERPGLRGSQKVCGIAFDDVYISCVVNPNSSHENRYQVPMGVGNYFDFEIQGPCGIVSDNTYIGIEDNPAVFYDSKRSTAQLLWFHSGYIEYRFPLEKYNGQKINEINFTVELCSEAPGYNNNWPSDIDIYLDNKHCGTINSQGDYGGTRGLLNPEWWSDSRTQFGILHVININENASYIDDTKVSNLKLKDLDLEKGFISLKIKIDEAAENVGGVNIFGEKFGNHPQGLVMEIITSTSN